MIRKLLCYFGWHEALTGQVEFGDVCRVRCLAFFAGTSDSVPYTQICRYCGKVVSDGKKTE